MENEVKILWLSKHPPLEAQISFLEQKLGNISLIITKGPFSTVDSVLKLVKTYKPQYVLPVLPLSFVVRLLEESHKRGFKILWSQMELLHIDSSPTCPQFNKKTDVLVETRDLNTKKKFWRHFRFKEILVLKQIKFEFEPL